MIDKKTKDKIIEILADLEHQQWMDWASNLAMSEKLSMQRMSRWNKLIKPYHDLDEEDKEKDRLYARRIVSLLISEGYL